MVVFHYEHLHTRIPLLFPQPAILPRREPYRRISAHQLEVREDPRRYRVDPSFDSDVGGKRRALVASANSQRRSRSGMLFPTVERSSERVLKVHGVIKMKMIHTFLAIGLVAQAKA